MVKKKTKITIFHCTLIYTGGGERIVFGQLDGLKKRGYDVSCYVPVMDKKRCYPDIIDQYPVYTLLPQLPSWFPFRHAILLVVTSLLMPFLVRRFSDTDLFIGENQPGTWLAFIAATVLRKPYLVYTCHPNKMVYPRKLSRDQIWRTQSDFYWLSIFFEPFKPVLKILDRLAFTQSRHPVLINGFFIGREFKKIYNVPWIGCPSGAPYISRNKQLKDQKNLYEGQIEIGDKKIDKPYLLFVGRHEVWKRIDLAIKAMVMITKSVPRASLIIPGPFTPHTQDLMKLAEKLGIRKKIIFTGPICQKDLAKLYEVASLFFFPSTKEDFGIVMLEAMGYGVPVVAWNSGGPTDMIVDGKNGLLAKPFEVEDFARKAIKILKNADYHHKLSRAAWETVRDSFSWEKHLEILEKAIRETLQVTGKQHR